MAQIDIRRANPLGKATARERTEALARRLEAKFDIRWQWKGDDLAFNAPQGPARGTTGTISIEESHVRVQVALPLLLRAFKGRVEDRVKDELDKLVG
ncbi:polyhydroxyalkanoic acid system family protein [Nannocystis sp. ILAH1]|uniref:polyhydroxyalkanoic acid system family protein n=1 Tax=unclassified Nannocystis TaxID=2627009 RepID=UPI0022702712|nr:MULTISPECIES: polyhydroxyalkanoic acid system family protein [unclassified Nannocystis]MCY0986063.1 polyhydroxyalkanoic acid system family protein [Nannocystis sp. ILAH1]MCY1068659.1 polyhydroxyalkanoic acid system family protein [Nannocystis sp. RBIL2]